MASLGQIALQAVHPEQLSCGASVGSNIFLVASMAGIIAHGADAPFYIEKRTMSCATALVAAVIR